MKKKIRRQVFIPAFVGVGGAAVIGIFKNEWLTSVTRELFIWTLEKFAWAYQWTMLISFFLVAFLAMSRHGKIRLGGEHAKPMITGKSWVAMTLMGGISIAMLAYTVSEPLIYYGSIYGELEQTGIEPLSQEAAIFGLGRAIFNWSFIPYTVFALSGVLVAYLYFNRKKELSVVATLTPVLGEKFQKGKGRHLIDILSVFAIALSLAGAIGMFLSLAGMGAEVVYEIPQNMKIWGGAAAALFTVILLASVSGNTKGIQWVAGRISLIFYVLLALLLILGPTVYILNMTNAGLGCWLDNFWTWGLDPYVAGGKKLVMWWTIYDWCGWLSYAPIMGIFFAMIAYGRTIREFLVVNWLIPSCFNTLWFACMGGTALHWQSTGKADIIGAIKESGAVAGVWELLKNFPGSQIIVPIFFLTILLMVANSANTICTTIATLCTQDGDFQNSGEASVGQKLLWVAAIGSIALIMVAFAGGTQGIEGIKYLTGCGGFVIFLIFILQLASLVKLFFIDKCKNVD